jgi:hypothetical protein
MNSDDWSFRHLLFHNFVIMVEVLTLKEACRTFKIEWLW